MRIVSGAVTDWISSWRGTSAPGDGERAAVEREAEQEPEQHDADRGDDVAVDVELAGGGPDHDPDKADQRAAARGRAGRCPITFPARSWRGRIALRSSSTTRVDFSSTTPVATQKP